MKVTPALKKELAQWLDTYWTTYLKGDIETWATFIRDDYRNIGGTKEEIWNSKQEIIDYTTRILDQMIGTAEIRNREIVVISYGEYMMVNEFTDLYVKAEGEWILYGPFRMSSLLEKTDTGWIALHQHGSYPDMKAMEGEAFSLDAVKAENAKLLEMVKSRTIELEIEAALERVRAVAMGMKIPEDMLDVCRVISDQLKQFGVEKIRNVQTAIIDENIGQYLCYQYFPAYEQTTIEDTEYHKSPVEQEMVRQMLVSRDGHFIGGLSENELEEFREHRKAENHFPDPLLDEASEISYCFLSIGEGGLGLSLYQAMEADVLTLFKRFHQVFSLAYQRFRDIQKAEAQAREAQIETALERVRTLTMAMHSSEDVGKCIVKMFSELTALGVDEGTRFGIGILNHDNENNQLWTARKDGEEVNMHIGNIDMASHPLLKSARKAWKEQVPLHKYVLEGEDLLNYYQMLNNAPDYKIQIAIEKLPKKEIQHCFIFEHGFFYAFTPREFQPELIQITQRFSALFEQTYRRYLDLVKAETQAREAQIEVALERIRSRSMAMHHSGELRDVLTVLFNQFDILGIKPVQAQLSLFDLENNRFTFRSTGKGGRGNMGEQVIDMDAMDTWKETIDTWKTSKPKSISRVYFPKETLPQLWALFDEVRKQLPEDDIITQEDFPDGVYVTEGNFNFGYIGFSHNRKATAEEEDIVIRIATEFGRLYQRFLDLQKAEAQAREAQIQLSLERIRAKAMAMQHSDELSDFLTVLFEQFEVLNLNPVYCHITFFDIDNNSSTYRITGKKGSTLIATQEIALDASPVWKQQIEEWKAGHPNDVDVLYIPFDILPEITKIFKEILEKIPEDERPLPEDFTDGQYVIQGFCKYGYLGYSAGGPPSDEEKEITKRIANEFGNVYQRFLDLQKAEAQAREAQIQLALERVRARTMAMQSSEELAEVSYLLNKQVVDLGIPTRGCAFNIYNEQDSTEWFSNLEGTIPTYKTPRENIFLTYYEAGQRGETLWIEEFGGDRIREHYQYLATLSVSGNEEETIVDNLVKVPEYQIDHVAYFKYGYLLFITLVPAPEAHEVFRRFAKEFEQTYTRFLDLQKAEAQTLEAKIEASLERVRSRTMGMQSSNELPEVANLLFTEVRALGIHAWSCGYNILAGDKRSAICWMSSEGTLQTPFQLRLWGEASFDEMGDFIQSEKTMLVQELGGKALEEHYAHMKSFPDLKPTFDEIDRLGLSLPTYQINHLCKFTQGFILFITYEKVPAAHDIFKRFTKVFEQTYTRFLDLKKAEAQAREAQIANALEKVRSRSLAMQSPDELIEVAQLLREEMGMLGVEELETSSIYIHDASSGLTECWFTIKNTEDPGKAVTDQMTIMLEDTLVGRQMREFFHSSAEKTSILMHGKDRIEWIRYCEGKTKLFGTSNFYGDTIPERTYHLYKFSNGYIGAAAPGEISPESWDLLKRATSVFSFAYTRFRDLQLAEASARASKRQASLDRVRADISSMRNADDLNRITPLVFNELTTLGIPFIRCGVFIVHEKRENVEIYLSSPEGKPLAMMTLPFDSNEMTSQSVEAWKKEEVYTQHWNQDDFVNWGKSMLEQGHVKDLKTYQGSESAPESLHLHFVPFTQGLLYVGSIETLAQEQIDLVKALAKSFAIAYARFEDFVKLEQAKTEVESAMSELKATQSQLVQQEKLASLGQLTAGIAHEIKNPLNFVNNFSEVSIEMIEEAIEERGKSPESRNETLVDEILEDIKSNLQKVHEHGTRANGIVTSMLQHSRGGSGKMEPTDLNALIKEYVNLSFHGMRANKNPIDVDIALDLDPQITDVPIIKEDFTRVVINLCNNAFDAMREKILKTEDRRRKTEVGDSENIKYDPKLKVTTSLENGKVLISFEDNGPGIPEEIKDKILQPFFTTKKGTEGTGLGLSITHDIIKAHGGEIAVKTSINCGTSFTIKLTK